MNKKTKLENKTTAIEDRLEKIEQIATKLDKELDITQKMIRVEAAIQAYNTKHEIMEQMKLLHNEQLNKLDFIVKELETTREERIVSSNHISELQVHMNQIEKRLSKVEKLQQTI